MDFFLQLIVNGLAIGAAYALISVGYSLVFSTLRLVNLAAGDVGILCAFIALALTTQLRLPFPLAACVALVVTAGLGMGIERVAYRPLKNAPPLMGLISAIGVSAVIQNSLLLIFGARVRGFGAHEDFIHDMHLGNVVVPSADLVILVTACASTMVLLGIVYFSRFGLAMRAVAVDREAAETVGIRSDQVVAMTFALSSFLSGIGGLMIASAYDIHPAMGSLLGFKAFVACVLGGLRNVFGALVAGLFLGIVENVAAGYLNAAYKDGYAFAVLVLVLLIRPHGLFGRAEERST